MLARAPFAAKSPATQTRGRQTRVVSCTARSQLAQKLACAAAAATLLACGPAFADGVAFKTPSNNATVKGGNVHLEFTVSGMEIRPAADGLIEGTGHFHVMIDEPEQFVEGRSIPFDETHLHFGKGQTEADITLPSGAHKVTLQFANALHQSYGPTYATTITVKVP